MSLIDEALKRARMEAAQKAAEGEGLPYPTIPRHLGPPRRRAWLGPLIVALAVIAGLLVGAMIATRGGSGSERTAALEPGAPIADTPVDEPAGDGAPRAEPVTSVPARREETRRDPVEARSPRPEPSGGEAPNAGTPVPPGVPPRQAKPPAPSAEPAPPPRAPSQVASTPSPAASPPAVADEESAPAAAPAPPPPAPTRRAPTADTVTDPDSGVLLVLPDRPGQEVAAPGSAESFVQQVTLPGGGAIELGGIAWSETGPFALINGRVVGPGAVIEGFTVERIRPGHVVLSGNGRRIQLSLQ